MRTKGTTIATRIGGKAYKIALLKVVPGKEQDVAGRIQKAIHFQRDCVPHCFLKVFGGYDIAAIYECDDFSVGVARYGSIPHILAANEILAFAWQFERAASAQPEVFRSAHNAWGFLLFKISPNLRKLFGIRIEQMAAHCWSRRGSFSRKVTVSVLGTVGWAELIVLAGGSDLSEVCDVLNGISRAAIEMSDGNQTKVHLFSAKTFSLVGIDFELTRQGCRADLIAKFHRQIGEHGIRPTFSVTCAPGDMARAAKLGRKLIGDPASTFGATDLVFQPRQQSWGKFIASVLQFRRALVGRLYSTRIGILSDLPSKMRSYPPPPNRDRGPVMVTKRDTERFHQWGPFFEPHLLNAYYGMSSLLQDPLVGECFEDMRPCLDFTLRELVHTRQAEQRGGSRGEAGALIETINYGTQQRSQGTFLTMEEVRGPFSPTRGGVQRVLKAISAVPNSLFRRIGLQWDGFAVVGFKYKGFSSELQIVNVPFDYLFSPEEWWGLFHETGHAAFTEARFIDLGADEVKEIRRRIYDDLDDPEQRRKWTNAFYELAAELFDLYFCYGIEIDTYLRNIWSYLQSPERAPYYRQNSNSYFGRIFCVYEFWKHLLSRKQKQFRKNLSISRDLTAFLSRLRNIGISIPDVKRARQDAEIHFWRLRPIIEWYATQFRKRPPQDLRSKFRDGEMREALAAVKRGKVWTRPLREPDVFILGLRKIKPLGFSSRLAAILTLWNTSAVALEHD